MDYYKILEVNKKSTQEEIKKSYKTLAMKYHPDRNKTPGSEDKFKEISRAYQILSNPKKRREYDLSGKVHHFNFTPAFTLFKKIFSELPQELYKLSSLFSMNSKDFPNMKDFLSKMSKRYNFQEKKETAFQYMKEYHELYKHINDINKMSSSIVRKEKPSSISYNINISLEDMYNKIEKSLPIQRLRRCKRCINLSSIIHCTKCNDEKYINETRVFKIQSDKRQIIFKDEGNEIEGYIKPGDIELLLRPKPHPLFEVDGYDIIYTKYITLYEAYTGIEINFNYLNGKNIIINYNGLLFNDLKLNDKIHYKILKDRGLVLPDNTRGDLKIKFVIKLPDISKNKLKVLECYK